MIALAGEVAGLVAAAFALGVAAGALLRWFLVLRPRREAAYAADGPRVEPRVSAGAAARGDRAARRTAPALPKPLLRLPGRAEPPLGPQPTGPGTVIHLPGGDDGTIIDAEPQPVAEPERRELPAERAEEPVAEADPPADDGEPEAEPAATPAAPDLELSEGEAALAAALHEPVIGEGEGIAAAPAAAEPVPSELPQAEPMQPASAAPAASAQAFTGPASGIFAVIGVEPRRLARPRGGVADDLTRVEGVSPAMAGALTAAGLFHVDQLAALAPEEMVWVAKRLGNAAPAEVAAIAAAAKRIVAEDGRG